MAHKLAFIGFGGVGQGLADILIDRADWLKESFGTDFQVVSITDLYKGTLHHDEGLDLTKVMTALREHGDLTNYPDEPGLVRDWDTLTTIQKSSADTILEITFTDIETGQPAIDHCKAAFEAKKNVVLTNKGPIALAVKELEALAQANGVQLSYEGTVMSGTPALRLPQETLKGNHINSIRGILNGTTNYMLKRMEEGLSYDEALQEAQEKGYAEADPTSDVEGYDVLYKVVILANVVLGETLTKDDVYREGISHLTPKDMEQALSNNCRWKLVGRIEQTSNGIKASVAPEQLPLTDPLSSISGAQNAITYDCDLSGPITLVGAGAGIPETGFALLIDLLHTTTQQ
ncbi:homoserine dehydrogenase [Salsuginibacillus halophilus]|uniref:Homoserine dehydrogenase n=1 Tax=Salsuginibacillus halophilus TaxID=517424 RepID=A0A2P8HWH6_9BACI|nr:homoserine dehydrogenase [Salsuginibacillus halophilus]PSL50577.1 homoserine dehydrogenase [Salsuginibacillus halophilus]